MYCCDTLDTGMKSFIDTKDFNINEKKLQMQVFCFFFAICVRRLSDFTPYTTSASFILRSYGK
jgi:hypothetical protein